MKDNSDPPSQILGEKYQIQKQLASKGGRKTLLACNLFDRESVIIKLLSFGNDFTWEDLKLFEREAETLKSLNHRSIPKYLDYFEVDSNNTKGFALVQSYIDAPSLEEQLKLGRNFSEDEVKQLAKEILLILDYLHSLQPPVIHRDLKPSNILLTNRSGHSVGDVYLVDFGSVQNLAMKQTSTMTIVGTYGYMPPEQFSGRATSASDLYGLGATLIHLVTGSHPADLPQTDLKIEFEAATNVNNDLKTWLAKLTHPLISRRFSSAKQAIDILENPDTEIDSIITQNKLEKPARSKIILNTTNNYLEIIFLSSEMYPNYTIFMSSLMIIISVLMIFLNLDPSLVIMWKILFVYHLYTLIKSLFAKRYCYISSEQIRLTTKIFGMRIGEISSPRKDICRLEVVRASQNYSYTSCLNIWAGTRNYSFADPQFSITTPETEWLAQEIGEYLNLPIMRDKYNIERSAIELRASYAIDKIKTAKIIKKLRSFTNKIFKKTN